MDFYNIIFICGILKIQRFKCQSVVYVKISYSKYTGNMIAFTILGVIYTTVIDSLLDTFSF